MRVSDREELPEKDRTITTIGRMKVVLNSGVILENPFGCIIKIEKVYYSKNKQRPTITYTLTKAYNTERIREPYSDFLKNKTFYGVMSKAPMGFNHWVVTRR